MSTMFTIEYSKVDTATTYNPPAIKVQFLIVF